MICRAPNCTVSLIATSNEMIRPVILSRPLKTAIGLLILSASAGWGAVSAETAASVAPASVGLILAMAGQARRANALAKRKRSMAGALLLKGGGMKALRGRDSRPRSRRRWPGAGLV